MRGTRIPVHPGYLDPFGVPHPAIPVITGRLYEPVA